MQACRVEHLDAFDCRLTEQQRKLCSREDHAVNALLVPQLNDDPLEVLAAYELTRGVDRIRRDGGGVRR